MQQHKIKRFLERKDKMQMHRKAFKFTCMPGNEEKDKNNVDAWKGCTGQSAYIILYNKINKYHVSCMSMQLYNYSLIP